MASRLGFVLQFLANGIAGFTVAAAVGAVLVGDAYNPVGLIALTCVVAGMIWLLGRGLRYVLAGV